jgi:hypothetical protein
MPASTPDEQELAWREARNDSSEVARLLIFAPVDRDLSVQAVEIRLGCEVRLVGVQRPAEIERSRDECAHVRLGEVARQVVVERTLDVRLLGGCRPECLHGEVAHAQPVCDGQ